MRRTWVVCRELPHQPRLLSPSYTRFHWWGSHIGGMMVANPVWRTSAVSNFGVFSLPLPFFQLGMIRTKDADYFLEPLPPYLTGKPMGSAQAGSPSHVLYKRSTEPQVLRANEVLMVTKKRDLARSHLHHSGNLHLGLPQKQHFCGRRKKCT